MSKFIALALLFVLSIANFGQKISIQTQKTEVAPTTQKVKPKTLVKQRKVAAKTVKTPKTEPKTAVKAQKTKLKTDSKPKVEVKLKAETKLKKENRPKAETNPQITTVEATTADGKDIMLKSDGTWAYKKAEPTTKPSPVAQPSPTARLVVIAKTTATPATSPNPSTKPTPLAKSSPVAKTKSVTTTSQCDLAVSDGPSIRGLRLRMTRNEADRLIPGTRITVINSTDIVAYPKYSKTPGFENVYQITAAFFDDKLSALEIVYDPDEVKWKSAKEFAGALSESFKLSPKFWKYNARNQSFAEMQCREFSLTIDAEANELSLRGLNATQKPARDSEAQKKVFKP